jgi:hypothetical protein
MSEVRYDVVDGPKRVHLILGDRDTELVLNRHKKAGKVERIETTFQQRSTIIAKIGFLRSANLNDHCCDLVA